jgi:dTDP-4-dehydrorhamnose 3,5-epimerase-like enzyme
MAHGFLTLEDNTIVTYMVKGEYNPESEHSIIWNQVDEVKSIIQDKLNQMNVEITISDKDQFGK